MAFAAHVAMLSAGRRGFMPAFERPGVALDLNRPGNPDYLRPVAATKGGFVGWWKFKGRQKHLKWQTSNYRPAPRPHTYTPRIKADREFVTMRPKMRTRRTLRF
jgi:hypothetical protein